LSLFTNALSDIQPGGVDKADIPAGEWLPDQPTVNNPGALEALNVVPFGSNYAPFPSHEPQVNGAVPDAVHGAAAALLPGGITQLYAGTANGLYTRLAGAPFVLLEAASVNQDFSWQFIPFKTLMVALHQSLFPVKMALGATVAPANVGGTPPRAACGAMCGDFLVLGNLLDDPDDAHAAAPNRIRWSGLKNIDANWVTNNATQADYNDMPPEGGDVIAISGRTSMTIFQERKISFGRYVNLPSVWDIETVEEDVGCIARDSVVSLGAYKFFIAQDGFRVWNGTNSAPIGNGKVDKYFFNRMNYGRRGRIVGATDTENGCVVWAFPTSSDGTLSEVILYSYRDNKWSHSIQTVEYMLSSAVSTTTTEDLIGFTDDYPNSYVDDPSYVAGGRRLLAAFNQQHGYGLYSGPNMAATIDTGEFSGPTNNRVFASNARPLVDVAQQVATVQPVGRDQNEGGALLYGVETAQEIDGTCPILADARYMRFRTKLPAGAAWSLFRGIEIARKAGGQF
jgi:hypothetical protein